MEEQTVTCPYCRREIALTTAISSQLREELRAEFEHRANERAEELDAKEKSLKAREGEVERQSKAVDDTVSQRLKAERQRLETELRSGVESEFRTQLADLSNAVGEKDRLLEEARKAELDLRKRQRELEEKAQAGELELKRRVDEERENLREEFEAASQEKESEIARRQDEIARKTKEVEREKDQIESEVAKRVQTQQGALEKEIKTKIESAYTVELQDLRAQVKEKDDRLTTAQQSELELRKERRQLEEEKKTIELEMNRKLDEERKSIREDAARAVTEDYRLKLLEQEKLISDLTKQAEEFKRKAEQGSQERQGEVMEIELENVLMANFPLDLIEPVPRGKKGADILQRIHNEAAQSCGTIIWESKRTKNWNEAWVEKLRDDQREARAEIAVILTATLPEEIENFGCYSGVWVTNYACLVGLATALRICLLQVAENKIAASGKTQKMEVLYNYFSGPMFRQKIEGMVEPFRVMKEDLDAEKRAMGRIWAKRERQIERVINNAVSMYGDVQGIIGASLPEIESMDLKALAPAGGAEPDVRPVDETSS
jgi:hypothetical protein